MNVFTNGNGLFVRLHGPTYKNVYRNAPCDPFVNNKPLISSVFVPYVWSWSLCESVGLYYEYLLRTNTAMLVRIS